MGSRNDREQGRYTPASNRRRLGELHPHAGELDDVLVLERVGDGAEVGAVGGGKT
jgi:hypothetical protein